MIPISVVVLWLLYLFVVLALLFGGGYFGYRRWGWRGGIGIFVLVLVTLTLLLLFAFAHTEW